MCRGLKLGVKWHSCPFATNVINNCSLSKSSLKMGLVVNLNFFGGKIFFWAWGQTCKKYLNSESSSFLILWSMGFSLFFLTTGCSEETANYKFVTALVVYHLESYGTSAFFTDNGTFWYSICKHNKIARNMSHKMGGKVSKYQNVPLSVKKADIP